MIPQRKRIQITIEEITMSRADHADALFKLVKTTPKVSVCTQLAEEAHKISERLKSDQLSKEKRSAYLEMFTSASGKVRQLLNTLENDITEEQRKELALAYRISNSL